MPCPLLIAWCLCCSHYLRPPPKTNTRTAHHACPSCLCRFTKNNGRNQDDLEQERKKRHLGVLAPLVRAAVVDATWPLRRRVPRESVDVVIRGAGVVQQSLRLVARLDHLGDGDRQADPDRVGAEQREEGHDNADPSLRDARTCGGYGQFLNLARFSQRGYGHAALAAVEAVVRGRAVYVR